jgi:hypothetical protein
MSDYPTEPRYAPAPVPGETFPLLRGMLRTAFEQQYGELYAEHVLPEEEFLFPPEAPALEALAASLPPDLREAVAAFGTECAGPEGDPLPDDECKRLAPLDAFVGQVFDGHLSPQFLRIGSRYVE